MLNLEDKLIGTEDKANFAYRFTFLEPEREGGLFTIERCIVLRESIHFISTDLARMEGDITNFITLASDDRITNGFISNILEYDDSLSDIFDLLNWRDQIIWERDGKIINRFEGEIKHQNDRNDFANIPISSIARIFAIAYTANKKKHYGFG